MDKSFNDRWEKTKKLLEGNGNIRHMREHDNMRERIRLGKLTAMCGLGLVTPPHKKMLFSRCPDCGQKLIRERRVCPPEESLCDCKMAWMGNSKIVYYHCTKCGYEYSFYKGRIEASGGFFE